MFGLNRKQIAWSLYDWGNSAFATTVMTAFFPVLFKSYWNAGVEPTVSTFRLGMANSASSLVVAVVALLLGPLSDALACKRRLWFGFAALGIAATVLLPLSAPGAWMLAAGLYVLGRVGFAGGNVFYDAMLVHLAPPDKRDRLSASGYAAGYLGGGLLLAVNVVMTLRPAWFGLGSATRAALLSLATAGLWWGLFAYPAFKLVSEPDGRRRAAAGLIEGARRAAGTLRGLRRHRAAWLFLLAYFLYIDGVHTVIGMSTDYGLSLGFPASSLVTAILLVQFVGFPAALGFGRLGERIGARAAILVGLGSFGAITLWAYVMTDVREFYVLAAGVGLVLGGVQSLSRSLFSRLIPAGRAGEFFGFYNVFGRFAAILGPALMGSVSLAAGSTRTGLLAVLVLFVAGGAVLHGVRD